MMDYEKTSMFIDQIANKLVESVDNNKIATHNGIFHAVDVFTTALIGLSYNALSKNNSHTVHRFWIPQRISNEEAKTFDGFLFDVGNEFDVLKLHFDHHQKDGPTYEDGVKMTSFGLLCLFLIPKIWGWDTYLYLKDFIKKVDEQSDQCELGNITNFDMSSIIYIMNKNWDENESWCEDESWCKETEDIYFKNAVKVAYNILAKLIINSHSQERADNIVNKIYNKLPKTNRFKVLLLNQYLPWKSSMMVKEDVIGAVYPSNRGGWNLEVKNPERYHLPDKWLYDEYKPEGMTFVHQALFLANFETKEHAQDAAEAFIACC